MVNENGRIRFALYTDESTMELVDKHYKEDGCGCKSEYITKAIQYYAELHSLGDCSHVVPDIIHLRSRTSQERATIVKAGCSLRSLLS